MWQKIRSNIEWVLAFITVVSIVGGMLADILPRPAFAGDINKIHQALEQITVQQTIQANKSIQQSIDLKEAEIRTIKTMYRYQVPPEVQPQIDALEADIADLESQKIK